MGAARKEQDIRKIETNYVQQQEELQMLRKQRRKRIVRRLIMFAVAAISVIGLIIAVIVSQLKEISLREEKLLLVQKQYEELLMEEQNLQDEIIRLNDDEYIAKLARKEYFLSKEGEINFVIPQNNNN